MSVIVSINFCQRHTQCGPYCLRTRDGKKSCSFHFPKSLHLESRVFLNSKGECTFEQSKNDALLNSYNPFVTSTWQANTDVQACVDPLKTESYVSKYISKSEPASKSLLAISKAMSNDDDYWGAWSFVRNTLSRCRSVDTSLQETYHQLTSQEYVFRSFSDVSINLQPTNDIILNDNGATTTVPCKLKPYLERQSHQESLSFFEFLS